MPALRTTLAAVGLGAATLTTGAVVAASATAAPAPVTAVEQLAAADEPTTTEATGTASTAGAASDGTARTRARGWWKDLTDAQRTCLQDQGVTRPVGPLDDAERAALRAEVEAAAKTCEVELPVPRARALWDGLTTEQQTCLKESGVNRPWGPLTTEQRQAVRADLRAAAEQCGVTRPAPTQG